MNYQNLLIPIDCTQKMEFPADLVTFTEEILNEKLHFLCSDCYCTYLENREWRFENIQGILKTSEERHNKGIFIQFLN